MTNLQTTPASLNLEQVAIPIQAGPAYHCFRCGAPAHGLQPWLPCGSPLDAWADHIAYLKLACACQKASRVARLDGWITPLAFHQDLDAFPSWAAFVDANVQAVRQAVASLAASIADEARALDTPARIVHQLLAGQLPPAEAVAQIRALSVGPAS